MGDKDWLGAVRQLRRELLSGLGLKVTDGATTVNLASEITFTGASVTDGGGGDAQVAVTHTSGDYVASQVTNDSSVTGSTVKDALNNLIAKALGTTKGDLIAFTASATPARLGVGSDGAGFWADSSQTAGVRWGHSPTVTANSGSSYTIPDSVTYGGFLFLTLNAATPTITMPTAAAGARFTGIYIQDGTGSRVPTFSPTPDYGSAGAPTLTTTASTKDTITYFSDGTTWFAFTTGLAF